MCHVRMVIQQVQQSHNWIHQLMSGFHPQNVTPSFNYNGEHFICASNAIEQEDADCQGRRIRTIMQILLFCLLSHKCTEAVVWLLCAIITLAAHICQANIETWFQCADVIESWASVHWERHMQCMLVRLGRFSEQGNLVSLLISKIRKFLEFSKL